MMQDEAIITSFLHHGRTLVADLTTLFLGRAMAGFQDKPDLREQLALAIERLARPECKLTLPEQVEIATFFLPLVREQPLASTPAVPPILRLNAQPQSGGPITVSANVQQNDALLVLLRILRNGSVLGAGATPQLTLSDAQPQPARLVYRAEATYANYPPQFVEITLAQPKVALFGIGPANPPAVVVQALTQVELQPELTLTFVTTSGPANMLLWLPPGQKLTAIINRNFGPTNLLASFASAPLEVGNLGTGTVYWSYQRISSSNYPLTFTTVTVA